MLLRLGSFWRGLAFRWLPRMRGWTEIALLGLLETIPREAVAAFCVSNRIVEYLIDTNRAFYTLRGIGSSGRTYCLAGECEPFPHSDSGRHIFVGSSTWVDVYLHEIGHAINWSHSYFLDSDSDQPNEYTNPMDVMSGSIGWVGTRAINRYAAGWIDPDDVKVWELGDKKGTYRLDPVGVSDGYQMLVIGDNHSTWYYMLGARVRDRFDEHLPKEGVERYLVDESADTDCGWDAWDWCPGTARTIVAAGKPRRPRTRSPAGSASRSRPAHAVFSTPTRPPRDSNRGGRVPICRSARRSRPRRPHHVGFSEVGECFAEAS